MPTDPYDPNNPENDPEGGSITLGDGRVVDSNGNIITSPRTVATPASSAQTSTGQTVNDDPFNVSGINRVTVPQNIAEWIREAAGTDPDLARITAAIIYQRMRWGTTKNPVTPHLIDRFVQTLRGQQQKLSQQRDPYDPNWRPQPADWKQVAQQVYGRGDPTFADAVGSIIFTGTGPDKVFATPSGGGPATIDDVYSLYESYTGDTISPEQAAQYVGQSVDSLRQTFANDPKAQDWRQYGKQVQQNRSAMTSIYQRYMNENPTIAQLVEFAQRGYTPQTLQRVLAGRPVDPNDPSRGTLGQRASLGENADQYAQNLLGRDADPGEINFMLQNGITTPDQIKSFYEQMDQRRQTGDPAFQWVGNPTQWRDMQSTIEGLWKRSGLTATVDPHLVNQAVSGNWSQDQITDYIDRLAAPGFPEGVTVGQVNRIRPIADNWKQTWYPDQKVSNTELQHFITNKFDSNQIHDYYGNMPSTTQQPASPAPKIDLTNPQHAPRQNAQTGVTQ